MDTLACNLSVVRFEVTNRGAAPLLPDRMRIFHHSELELKRKVNPSYPMGAEAAGHGTVRCRVTISIDERGVPFEVQAQDCPEVFHAPTEQAVLKWRWYPPRAGQETVKARTTLQVQFKP
jgi:outer membrane biosynthesis protein TonB